MTISLPASIVPRTVEPFLLDFGTVLTPFSGGPAQRINRLGLRIGGNFTIPPKLYRGDGRVLVSRLMQAKTDRLLMPWPQPGLVIGSEGTPRVRVAVSGGTTLQLKGLPAAKALLEGQYLSVVKDRRYLHALTDPATVDGSGNVTLSVWPPMRWSFEVDDVVEIAQPKIEGLVLPDSQLTWSISVDRTIDLSFSVVEGK